MIPLIMPTTMLIMQRPKPAMHRAMLIFQNIAERMIESIADTDEDMIMWVMFMESSINVIVLFFY
jgi:hypothetical protein